MQYPLPEKIGHPDLLVGREAEFAFIHKWVDNIPRRLSKSKVMLARRKSGKTVFIQRLFNQLWSDPSRGVIPFYFSMPEAKVWYPTFAVNYFCTFASQYIAYLERDASLVRSNLTLEEIGEYGVAKGIRELVRDSDLLGQHWQPKGAHSLMWEKACAAPHRYASLYDQRFLVLLDEFQYISIFIYRDEVCEGQPDETMPGSYHTLSESKLAPMLVTGSYFSWMQRITFEYLEAGRLSYWQVDPYLTPEAGLMAVYKYAELYQEPITNDTALMLNELCGSDPFFISCVIQSHYPKRDLTTEEGVKNTVHYEIANYKSELSTTWAEYIPRAVDKVNDQYGKHILLHLSKHNDRDWTPQQLKDELNLPLTVKEIHTKLEALVDADVITWGESDIDYRGLQDGTLYKVLRHRFQKEIDTFEPSLMSEFSAQVAQLKHQKKKLQGMLSQLIGKFAELQLAGEFRSRHQCHLSDFFAGVTDDHQLTLTDVRTRLIIQRPDGKNMELDVVAQATDSRVVIVEVKKWQRPVGPTEIDQFATKVTLYQQTHPDKIVLPAYLSLGGFTPQAQQQCHDQGIATAEQIAYRMTSDE